ncbi:nitroreductase [Algivirga pacifica]|uniref:Putative NAD(P)H nitroreductase n=1 Tax=Algivirga pacifica TaxID=1162670 RepID=A0ABP9DAH6_9BACT
MSDKHTLSPYDTEAFNQLVKNRRSYFPKEYTGEEVPEEVILQMLENANWAPNHGRTEPWRFFVFAGEGRKKLGEIQSEMYREHTVMEKYDKAKEEKLAAMPMQASHVIAVCMDRQETERIPEVEEIEAVACAVQNMYLTIEAYGYGGYWSSGGITYMEAAKELFGLGLKDRLLGFFYVGVPKQRGKEGQRGDVQEKVTWVREA